MQSKNILFFFFATLHIFSKLLFGNIIKNLIKLSVLNTKKKESYALFHTISSFYLILIEMIKELIF